MNLLIVVGYGPGISHATAERFGRQGYAVALVGRDADRLSMGVDRLTSNDITARGYQADASNVDSIISTLRAVRQNFGPATALLWTAFRSGYVKDVLSTDPHDIEHVFDIGVAGLLAATQELLADLKASAGAAILVANGALGEATEQADELSKYLNNDGVALENAAKTKLIGILAARLREHGIYVGEVTIAGSVAGTATGTATAIDPSAIADQLWSMTQDRSTTRVRMVE